MGIFMASFLESWAVACKLKCPLASSPRNFRSVEFEILGSDLSFRETNTKAIPYANDFSELNCLRLKCLQITN